MKKTSSGGGVSTKPLPNGPKVTGVKGGSMLQPKGGKSK